MNSATYNTTPRWLSIVLGIASILFGWLFLTNPGTTLLGHRAVVGPLLPGDRHHVHHRDVHRQPPGSKLWKLIGGILAIIAGVVLLANPIIGSIATGATFNFLVAFFAIIAGIALLIDGFQGGGCLAIILGILGIVLGILVLFNPLSGMVALPHHDGHFRHRRRYHSDPRRDLPPEPAASAPAPVRAPVPPEAAPKVDVNKAVVASDGSRHSHCSRDKSRGG